MTYHGCLIKEDENCERYLGIFGEELSFYKQENNLYNFISVTLGLYDIKVTEESKERIINSYCYKGNDDFSLNRKRIMPRALALGEMLKALYTKYLKTKEEDLIYLIEEILLNIETFKLCRSKYIDWFLSFGEDKDDEYIRKMLFLRKKIRKTQLFLWKFKIDCDSKSGIKINYNQVYAHAKKEAIKASKETFKDVNNFKIVGLTLKTPVRDYETLKILKFNVID